MTDILLMLSQKSGFLSMIPASKDQVIQAEDKLGVHFSDDYRKYVLAFGVASYYGHELTGIYNHPSINVVDVTLSERDFSPDISQRWYVVEQAHIDGIVVWQSEDGAIYQSAPNSIPVKKFSSLAEYVELCS